MKQFKFLTFLLTGIIILNSCGLLFYGSKQKVTVNSTPSGAKIYVNGENTGQVTPAEVKVKRRVKDSPTSVKKKMTYTLKKEGYADYTQVDDSKFNHTAFWLDLAVSIFTVGIPSISDAVVGVNRTYPKAINVSLSPGSSSSNNLLIDRSKEEIPTENIEPEKTEVITKEEKTTPPNNITANTTIPNNKNEPIVEAKTTPLKEETKPIQKKETPTIVAKRETVASTFEPVVILDEDFSDNSFGWNERLEKKATYQVKDGVFYMKDNTLSLKAPRQFVKNFNSKTDNYILEASLSFNDDKNFKMVGIGLGFSPDSSIHYVFNLLVEEGVKKVAITPFLGVGFKTMNQEPIFKGVVNAISLKENIIKIEKTNSATKFYVNNTFITEFPGFVFNSSLIKFSSGIWNSTAVNWIKIIKTGECKEIITQNNIRDLAYQEIQEKGVTYNTKRINDSETEPISSDGKIKIKNATENQIAKDLKYRRSSLHTMMIYDPIIEHHETIKNAFGNLQIPLKFNDHNVGPYSIMSIANIKEQESQITNFLTTNDIAKKIVSKWFNRNSEGKYDIKLIAERGLYNASSVDKAIAGKLERGNAFLADAGEELISKTFVVVHDLKFINKEKTAGILTKALDDVAKQNAKDGNLAGSAMSSALSFGASAAGKGYIINSTSYLYQLVWDEETAAIFYQNYWTDENNFDPSRVEAFNNATNFKLKFIGSQSALADVQSSIFTEKSDEELVKMATVKAIDKAIAKLERKFEDFKTKTPLYSSEPLAAKIGLKEGLEQGDKFEVLQQEITNDGKTVYKKMGVIKVDQVWDNSLNDDEMEQLKKEGKLQGQQYTTFKGSGNFYPGQLIKQLK